MKEQIAQQQQHQQQQQQQYQQQQSTDNITTTATHTESAHQQMSAQRGEWTRTIAKVSVALLLISSLAIGANCQSKSHIVRLIDI